MKLIKPNLAAIIFISGVGVMIPAIVAANPTFWPIYLFTNSPWVAGFYAVSTVMIEAYFVEKITSSGYPRAVVVSFLMNLCSAVPWLFFLMPLTVSPSLLWTLPLYILFVALLEYPIVWFDTLGLKVRRLRYLLAGNAITAAIAVLISMLDLGHR